MDEIRFNPSPKVRGWIYSVLITVSLIATYLGVKDIIGTHEMALVTGLSTLVAFMARVNLTPPKV